MFHIDNYVNTPAATVAIALIAAVFALTLIVYLHTASERVRRRKVAESVHESRGRVVTVVNNYDDGAE